MSLIINGQTGPWKGAGAYGANALNNLHKLYRDDNSSDPAIRYTPTTELGTQVMYNNAFGFSFAELQHNSPRFSPENRLLPPKNSRKRLSWSFKDMLPIAKQIATVHSRAKLNPKLIVEQWLKIIDLDNDKHISLKERVAWLLFTDDSTGLLKAEMDNMKDDPARQHALFDDQEKGRNRYKQANAGINNMHRRMPSKFDGMISHPEQDAAWVVVRSKMYHALGRSILEKIYKNNNLDTRMENFLKEPDPSKPTKVTEGG